MLRAALVPLVADVPRAGPAPVRLCLHYTRTPGLYTLSLHDALPISSTRWPPTASSPAAIKDPDSVTTDVPPTGGHTDRKSTRLNSSHLGISYAVFCLKKKNEQGKDNAYSDQKSRSHHSRVGKAQPSQ